MMTSAQVVDTSVTVTDNYPHPDDHTTQSSFLMVLTFSFIYYIGKRRGERRGKRCGNHSAPSAVSHTYEIDCKIHK